MVEERIFSIRARVARESKTEITHRGLRYQTTVLVGVRSRKEGRLLSPYKDQKRFTRRKKRRKC